MMKKFNLSEYPIMDWDRFKKVMSDHILYSAIRDWELKKFLYLKVEELNVSKFVVVRVDEFEHQIFDDAS